MPTTHLPQERSTMVIPGIINLEVPAREDVDGSAFLDVLIDELTTSVADEDVEDLTRGLDADMARRLLAIALLTIQDLNE